MALEKEERIIELQQSGSAALKSIDDFGRHTFLAPQMGGEMDGEIAGRLRRMKYDEEELIKAIDTSVNELIKSKPAKKVDVVPLEDYETVLARVEQANRLLEQVRAELAGAKGNTAKLESQIQGFISDLDASLVRVAVAENQSEATNDKFVGTVNDLQQSIQKGTLEAIERVSLEAQVEGLAAQKEALVSQVASLEETLSGKSSAVAQGGKAAGNKFTAIVKEKTEPTKGDLRYYEANKGPNTGWKNGPTIEILNISEDTISISFTKTGSVQWLNLPGAGSVSSGEKRIFRCSKRGGWQKGDKKGSVNVVSGAENVTFSAEYRGDKNSKKIVCAELYHQGWIPYEIFRADEDWGDAMFLTDPKLVIGYQMWSKHIVNFMRKNPQYTGLIYYGMSKYWCHWMAHQMGVVPTNNLLGQAIHWVGKHLSYYVYDTYGGDRIYRFLLKQVLIESVEEFKQNIRR
tara:strand:+ start:17453 stop:18832 length:1380 start_codon:yes stop_codon:yes gene_type:complete